MDDLKRMAVFATVVQHGSMTAAARSLGMSPSAVSQHIRQLEREGGVTLLHRSTRQISLTDAGQRFYVQCATLSAAAERARAELAAEQQVPSGELRLAAPVGFAHHTAPALGAWLARFPQLRLRLLLDDVPIDLIQARVDLALRFGPQADSNWVARKLASTPNWLCAAPAWIHARGGVPQHPAHLAQDTWLTLSHRDQHQLALIWQHLPSGERFTVQAMPRALSNHQTAVQALCEAGLGVAVLSAMDVTESVQSGRLVQLLPEWDMGLLDIWAVTPQRDAQPAKVRQAIEELQAYFATLHGVNP
ncbi:LysR family transcriptional regulator [Comamonas sp. CMM02]|uniref:LysR family transcriptional regulator n=1 Tax=Comamonas sp. CMM02 TaxID=2769307 RepID=UPI001781B872|nr:LysR family transcriptional regulator [Comamonas sp. CMM02]MBD9401724.1 LysR family transcriptional regulator [Comamonas sp. CMM02]